MLATAKSRTVSPPPLAALETTSQFAKVIDDLSARLTAAEAKEAELLAAEDAALFDGKGDLASVRANINIVRQEISDLRRLNDQAHARQLVASDRERESELDGLMVDHEATARDLEKSAKKIHKLCVDLREAIFETFALSQKVDRSAFDLASSGRRVEGAAAIRGRVTSGQISPYPHNLPAGLRGLDQLLQQMIRGNRLWLPSSPVNHALTGRESWVRAMTGGEG